ncbi:hypothetical protein E1263_24220 [Kribbella antibiotica]|uniref:Uncharacterized protein n=1 Tax=Kribbella antibiotica TaxID=190195 RepID=A0A4R4ZFL1_9ACTN|nr:SIR2 family protein [Kribbella antibiotica]TDD57341.1 hypothetical protein E1263_24220 [Kribbella antibiotica]
MRPEHLGSVLARPDTIVFVGSGVSIWSGMPSWGSLLEGLAEHLDRNGYSSELIRRELAGGDYLLAASYGFDGLTEMDRCVFLRSVLLDSEAVPSELHRAIAGLGSRCFVTTNYDRLLERGLSEYRPGEYYEVVTPLQQLEVASIVQARSERFVFKPHGDLGSCDSIVLTREDYREFHSQRRHVFEAMRTLLLSRPVVFIGFGLKDPAFLLIRDSIYSAFGGNPADHFAIMPDVLPAEADYWRRNYGIHLVSYATNENARGSEKHAELLELLHGYDTYASRVDRSSSDQSSLPSDGVDFDSSAHTLALARHARRLKSVIPVVEEPIPLEIKRTGHEVEKIPGPMPDGADAISNLATLREGILLEGSPGAGKSFVSKQVVRGLAEKLEDACLTSGVTDSGVRVPLFVELREYRGNLKELIESDLPSGIDLDFLLQTHSCLLFLDGFNEAPARAAADGTLVGQIRELLDGAEGSGVVISTRHSGELHGLNLPVYALDAIPMSYVLEALESAGHDPAGVGDQQVELLARPLFFRAWADRKIRLEKSQSVHDIYAQLIGEIETGISQRLGTRIDLGDLLGSVAFDVIDGGGLTASLGQIDAVLRRSTVDLPRSDVLNALLSDGVLIPAAGRRVAFFHHSITEYLAASHLAKLIQADSSIVHRCLRRPDWDQTLLLTLGFLPSVTSHAVFDEVLTADPAMALRALSYADQKDGAWLERALIYLRKREERPFEFELTSALDRLHPHEQHIPALLDLVENAEANGAHGAGPLWRISEASRPRLIDLLLDPERGYNFQTAMASSLRFFVSPKQVLRIIEVAAEIVVESADRDGLLAGVEVDRWIGTVSALSEICQDLPVGELVQIANHSDSVMVDSVICNCLRDIPHEQSFEYLAGRIADGLGYPIFDLHMLLEYEYSRDVRLPHFPELIPHLIDVLQSGGGDRWAGPCVSSLVSFSEEYRQDLVDCPIGDGLFAAYKAWILGDETAIFDHLAGLLSAGADWSSVPLFILRYADLDWSQRSATLLSLLRIRDEALAEALLTGLRDSGVTETSLTFHLEDLAWWIDWLRECATDESFLAYQLGQFLSNSMDADNRREAVGLFNAGGEFRAALDEYVLALMPELNLSHFTDEAVDWMVGNLSLHGYRFAVRTPLLASVADENLVQDRLIPALVDGPGELLRRNLLVVLREAGEKHGRRYVADDGSVLG